jgi:predicted nucleic acid-binding protein
MSVVVANSSPICYLTLIDQIQLLPALFGKVIIPEAVVRELSVEGAPESLRQWIAKPPEWLKILKVPAHSGEGLDRLHPREREVIVLARQIQADIVVLDEKAARRTARELGLHVTGLLGILEESATRGMVDLLTAVERLRETSFRASPQLLKALTDRHFSH